MTTVRTARGRVLRPLAGALTLVALGWHFGADPFIDGLRRVDAGALVAALAITAGTTWCGARRWSLLAGQLAVPVTVGAAYAACFRAQFLNSVLPGGVVGDVDRGFRHGREAGAPGRGLRSVAWDRTTGQVVQTLLAAVAVLWLTAPVQRAALWAVLIVATVAMAAYAATPRRLTAALWAEVRRVPGAPGVWQQVVGLSALAAAGHVAVYVVAARTAGVDVGLDRLVPLALVVLVAAAIPLNMAGWGPREGAAAWVFAAVGLGGATGIEVTVVYGVMALVATLPGAVTMVCRGRRPRVGREGGAAWLSVPTRS